jgi:hypothetical protein
MIHQAGVGDMDAMDLKVARVRAGLTLWELGKLADTRPERISEMETGKREIGQAVVDALEQLREAKA